MGLTLTIRPLVGEKYGYKDDLLTYDPKVEQLCRLFGDSVERAWKAGLPARPAPQETVTPPESRLGRF